MPVRLVSPDSPGAVLGGQKKHHVSADDQGATRSSGESVSYFFAAAKTLYHTARPLMAQLFTRGYVRRTSRSSCGSILHRRAKYTAKATAYERVCSACDGYVNCGCVLINSSTQSKEYKTLEPRAFQSAKGWFAFVSFMCSLAGPVPVRRDHMQPSNNVRTNCECFL